MELINRRDDHIAVIDASNFFALDEWPLCGSRAAATEPIMYGSYGPFSSFHTNGPLTILIFKAIGRILAEGKASTVD